MITTSNIVLIENGRVLLVLKKGVWILPGGKHEHNESDEQCLLRECSEELPSSFIVIGSRIGTFQGITPHSKRPVEARVFFGTITTVSGNITVGAEIERGQWFTKMELGDIPVSSLTATILDSITFCTDGLPQTMIDPIGSDEDKATWIFHGPFPIKEIAAGKRACRHGWRNRSYSEFKGVKLEPETEDGTWPMLSASLDNNESNPGIIIGTEYAEEFGETTFPLSIKDMLATDWYLELEK